MNYIGKVGTAFSRLIGVMFSSVLNVIFHGGHKFGSIDETISSVLGKNIRDNDCFSCKIICFFLDFINKDHCKDSIDNKKDDC